MKTAMQEMLERLKSLKSKGYDDAGVRTGIEIATQLLAKEKQDIIDARINNDSSIRNAEEAETYYNEKYKT